MHGPPMPGPVSVFSREIQRVLDGLGHLLRRVQGADGHITVRASRIVVALPIMHVPAQERWPNIDERARDYSREGGKALIEQRAGVTRGGTQETQPRTHGV